MHSRNGSIPRLLRVTNRHSGYDPREPAQRAGLLRGDNTGWGLVYALTKVGKRCTAVPKTAKPFLEPWDLSVGRTALYRTSSHTPDLFFKKNSSPLLTTPLPLWYSTYNYVNVREAHTP